MRIVTLVYIHNSRLEVLRNVVDVQRSSAAHMLIAMPPYVCKEGATVRWTLCAILLALIEILKHTRAVAQHDMLCILVCLLNFGSHHCVPCIAHGATIDPFRAHADATPPILESTTESAIRDACLEFCSQAKVGQLLAVGQ